MRARARSAAVVAAVIAGAALVPSAAEAVAPAADSQPLLRVKLGAPTPSGPLTRGGATETFELTVENPGTKARPYHPWLLLDQNGPSPLQKADITYRVEPVNAPETAVFVGHQDGGWQGAFHPASGAVDDGFEVPAGSKLTWKVTVGLTKSYPTINGGFKLTAGSVQRELERPDTLSFAAAPHDKPGTFRTWIEKTGGCEGLPETQCQSLNVRYKVSGHGSFDDALLTQLFAGYAGVQAKNPDLVVQAKVDGHWKVMKGDDHTVDLPAVAKGLGADSGERNLSLRVKLGNSTGIRHLTRLSLRTETRLDAENNWAFAGAPDTEIVLGPVKASPAPSTSPSGTPSPSGTSSTSPSGTPTTGSSATASTAPTSSASPSTPAAAHDGSLASTGSDSTMPLYVAAGLVALGGLTWIAARRRRAHR
ncbi:LPXTG cell wall anchor domain-containing protein [Streptomyces sp. NPDC056463]|uniref:LPXTG cell wall anchor domain-containing protein n=1 Tax=unclassified Streptomyces TaxID=2593676 RepID=UPI0036B6A8EC